MSTGRYGPKGNNIDERAAANSGEPGARRKRENKNQRADMKSSERGAKEIQEKKSRFKIESAWRAKRGGAARSETRSETRGDTGGSESGDEYRSSNSNSEWNQRLERNRTLIRIERDAERRREAETDTTPATSGASDDRDTTADLLLTPEHGRPRTETTRRTDAGLTLDVEPMDSIGDMEGTKSSVGQTFDSVPKLIIEEKPQANTKRKLREEGETE